MTETELLQYVDDYFENHLDSGYWDGLTDSVKGGAIAMALSDIMAELSITELDDTNTPSLKAVAEQAVFLARNYENLTENKITTSESIEGISESFSVINDKPGISFRASAFIKQAQRALLSNFSGLLRG